MVTPAGRQPVFGNDRLNFRQFPDVTPFHGRSLPGRRVRESAAAVRTLFRPMFHDLIDLPGRRQCSIISPVSFLTTRLASAFVLSVSGGLRRILGGRLRRVAGMAIEPGLQLALGKDHQAGASQSMLSRLENDVLGNAMGLEALDGALTRATDALLKRKNKKRLIIDLDSTEDPPHGKQEGVAYNGHFPKNCFHPLFCFTSDGDWLAAKVRPGNVHSDDGAKESP
jgi:hypothetical protein